MWKCPDKKAKCKFTDLELLHYPEMIELILLSVINMVDVSITLKIGTGFLFAEERSCIIYIPQLRKRCAIQAITIHDIIRSCLFNGLGKYDIIRAAK